MAVAIISIKMMITIMVIGKMTTVMDREPCTTVMDLPTLVDGKKASNTALAFLLFRKVTATMANG